MDFDNVIAVRRKFVSVNHAIEGIAALLARKWGKGSCGQIPDVNISQPLGFAQYTLLCSHPMSDIRFWFGNPNLKWLMILRAFSVSLTLSLLMRKLIVRAVIFLSSSFDKDLFFHLLFFPSLYIKIWCLMSHYSSWGISCHFLHSLCLAERLSLSGRG